MDDENDSMEMYLTRIDERLQQIVGILKMTQRGQIEIAKNKILDSPLKKSIYELCDGKHSVGEISKKINKLSPSVSRAIAEMEAIGILGEVKVGKKTFYQKLM